MNPFRNYIAHAGTRRDAERARWEEASLALATVQTQLFLVRCGRRDEAAALGRKYDGVELSAAPPLRTFKKG